MNYSKLLKEALKEDTGKGDITTKALIPKNKFVRALISAKEPCVVCGLGEAAAIFKLKDKEIKFKPLVKEGAAVKKGEAIARLSGRARSILTAERVALNFISLLSGVASKTREYVSAAKPFKVRILDTRKTIPCLRLLEKYAVRIGGGFNHRSSLEEMVLIKDNHIKIVGGYNRLQGTGDRLQGKGYKIELEVKDLKEFKEALKLSPDIIMLDNMSVKNMKKAVAIRNNLSPNTYPRHKVRRVRQLFWRNLTPKLEASGGITLKNIKQVAACGIDLISVGALTHSVRSVDISLEVL